jgi:serine/threonine protein kinase
MTAANAPVSASRRGLARAVVTRAEIEHPNLLGARLVRAEDGRVSVRLESSSAPTLAEVLARRKLSTRDALRIVRDVAAAVHVLSNHGLIARDVTPGKIKLDPSRGAILADHGIPFDLAPRRPSQTRRDLAYRSPEENEGRAVDARSSVYSLGAILYTILTGRRPPESRPGWRPAGAPGELPRAIAPVIERAMAHEPADRYADVRELTHAAVAAFHDEASSSKGATRRPERTPSASSKAPPHRTPSHLGPRPSQRPRPRAVPEPEPQRPAAPKAKPKLQWPQIKDPEGRLPQPSAPQVRRTQPSAPESKRPEVKTPQPSAPLGMGPRPTAPLGNAAQPRAPLGKAPQRRAPLAGTPLANAPQVTPPGLKPPPRKAPDIKLPRVKVPRPELPKLPRVKLSRPNLPKLPRPKVSRPELPKLSVKVSRPDLPKLPRVKVARPDLPKLPRPRAPQLSALKLPNVPALRHPALIATLIALVACAIAGVLLGRSTGEEAQASQIESRALTLQLPDGWEPTEVLRNQAINLSAPAAAAPLGGEGAGLVVGRVSDTVTFDRRFRDEIGPEDARTEVQLGPLQAWRYEGLTLRPGLTATAYLAPTTGGPLLILCHARPQQASLRLPQCERMAATISLRGARPLPLAGVDNRDEQLDSAMTALSQDRRAARRRLARAELAKGQAKVALALERVYDRTAERVQGILAADETAPYEELVGALTATAGAYRRLARAAARADRGRYRAAIEAVREREAAVHREAADPEAP